MAHVPLRVLEPLRHHLRRREVELGLELDAGPSYPEEHPALADSAEELVRELSVGAALPEDLRKPMVIPLGRALMDTAAHDLRHELPVLEPEFPRSDDRQLLVRGFTGLGGIDPRSGLGRFHLVEQEVMIPVLDREDLIEDGNVVAAAGNRDDFLDREVRVDDTGGPELRGLFPRPVQEISDAARCLLVRNLVVRQLQQDLTADRPNLLLVSLLEVRVVFLELLEDLGLAQSLRGGRIERLGAPRGLTPYTGADALRTSGDVKHRGWSSLHRPRTRRNSVSGQAPGGSAPLQPSGEAFGGVGQLGGEAFGGFRQRG